MYGITGNSLALAEVHYHPGGGEQAPEVRRRLRADREGAEEEIGLFKVERPEIRLPSTRLLPAAMVEGAEWYVAVCLAGEAGLRSGEIKTLRWREDVDLIAKTITVNRQTCHGETTTPKGRTRRTIPMTSTLERALRRLETVRDGFVVRSFDGNAKRDGETCHAIERICRRAGLPVSFAPPAARGGRTAVASTPSICDLDYLGPHRRGEPDPPAAMLRPPLGQPGMSQGQSRSSAHGQLRRRGYALSIKPSRTGAARTRETPNNDLYSSRS